MIKLRTGQDLKTGRVKKIVRSVFEISVFEIADPKPNMDSMGHFQVSSTYSQRVLKLMKFWSNLGLVRTLKLASLKKIVRSVFVISVFEIADAIPNMGSMGHFQVSSTHIREFETNEILVKLRTGQDLETGRV